jgi:hypothetical protein
MSMKFKDSENFLNKMWLIVMLSPDNSSKMKVDDALHFCSVDVG